MPSAAAVARSVWLAYLHFFFVLHQPLLPLPPSALRTRQWLPVLGSESARVQSLTAARTTCEYRPVVARGGVRRSPPTQAELKGLAEGFRKLQSAASTQRKPHARDALTQLAWHWNKAVLDHCGSGDEMARVAATHAVNIAASTWPYWLAWPETHAALALALGSETSAAVAVDQARTRFPPQRWQGWWRELQPRANGGISGLEHNTDSTVLPPPRRIMPFASIVMLCTCVAQSCDVVRKTTQKHSFLCVGVWCLTEQGMRLPRSSTVSAGPSRLLMMSCSRQPRCCCTSISEPRRMVASQIQT